MEPTKTLWALLLIYSGAAFFEIAGCFAFWGLFRLSKPLWWAIPGTISLIVFGLLLTRIDMAFAGRTYAAYGGIYIGASLVWLWLVEGKTPDLWDSTGAMLCLAGALVILLGNHHGG